MHEACLMEYHILLVISQWLKNLWIKFYWIVAILTKDNICLKAVHRSWNETCGSLKWRSGWTDHWPQFKLYHIYWLQHKAANSISLLSTSEILICSIQFCKTIHFNQLYFQQKNYNLNKNNHKKRRKQLRLILLILSIMLIMLTQFSEYIVWNTLYSSELLFSYNSSLC